MEIKQWILSLIKNRKQHEKIKDKIKFLENKIIELENKNLILSNNIMGGGSIR